MHITVLALGSRGDVQPIVTLGGALTALGHRVRVATFEAFRPLVAGAGLEFAGIRGDAQGLLRRAAEGERLLRRPGVLGMAAAIRRSYASLAASIPEDLQALDDTDLVLNQLPAHLFGADLAEHLGVPWGILTVIPLVRTTSQPLMGFPAALSNLPGYNLLTYRIGEQVGWQLFRRAINRLRTESWGLSPQPLMGPYESIYREGVPFLCGFSQHVVPRPRDWGNQIHITGWWYPYEAGWRPPDDLRRFLDTGPPPVFLGFGSMPVGDPVRLTGILLEAVEMAGVRAVLHRGWAGLGGNLPPEIHEVGETPYGWLFPRMAAVVHHGGSGTTGLSLRSGVPSVIVPFVFDQFYWGSRVAELGVGPEHVPYRQLTAERLAGAIERAVGSPEMRRRAAELGAQLSKERGLQRAVELIEGLWG